jgi:transcriptional regulator of acetoin/glycerol metabolism
MQSPTAETLDDVPGAYSLPEMASEPQLFVAMEGDRPLAGGARYSLAGVHEVIIGRGAERVAERQVRDGITTLSLRLPARSLSTVHARMVRANQQWILEDAQSRNGSFLDGQQVERAAWGDHNIVQLGHVFFLLRASMLVARDTPTFEDAAELTARPLGLRTLVPQLGRKLEGVLRIARAGVPILLFGETGTGKELLARAAHELAGRGADFISLSCASLRESSAALEAALGSPPASSRGTLFLDEISDLEERAQTELLRLLQPSEAPSTNRGATALNVLVVSATHRALHGTTGAPRLRQDLLARLSGYTLTLPPLRERMEDFGLIVSELLRACVPEKAETIRLSASAGSAFFSYAWPLNIRELQHVLLSSVALSRDGVIHLDHLPAAVAECAPRRHDATAIEAEPAPDSLSDEERRLRAAVLAQLRQHYGNVAAVARAMNKAPMQIHRWMKRFGLDPLEFRNAAKRAR